MQITRHTPEAKLSRFHPVRFFLHRKEAAWSEMSQDLHTWRQEDRKWSLMSVDELILSQAERENQLPFEEIEGLTVERVGQIMESDCGSLEMALSMWRNQGEQIFDVSPVSAMFLDSDASKLPIAFLKLPYDTLYLHWGKHLELPSSWPGRFIEGCYVNSGKSMGEAPDLDISFTFVCSDAPDYHWDEHSLAANIITDVEGILDLLGGLDNAGTIGALIEQYSKPGYAPDGTVERWAPYVPAALSMAANCLCFLSSPKGDVQSQFPADAPKRLTNQLDSQRPKEVRRAQSKLNALGFRTIHLCGQRLAARVGLAPGSRTLPTHWRKGHWRATRFGKGRVQVKVDWIDATVVNAASGTPEGGHLYVP